MPLPLEKREMLEKSVCGGAFDCEFIYKNADDVIGSDIAGFSAVIGKISPDLLKNAEKLEWLQVHWAGVDPFVGPGILPDDCVLTNASGAYGLAVSEHMIAFTFALLRNFDRYARQQSEHVWAHAGKIGSVSGSHVLVLGLGDIGGDYAAKMKALGAHVTGVKRTPVPMSCADRVCALEDIDALLPSADIVALALPGGKATRHVIDARRLKLMKKSAYIVNAGRGNAIDTEALWKALENGELAGAALDVFENEPLPASSPVWDLPNLIITPHAAGHFLLDETFNRVFDIVCGNLNAWAHGKELSHVVNRELGY